MVFTERFNQIPLSECAYQIDNNQYKLKLTSKKLKSGKCQVKFYATVNEMKDLYGYVLVDADKTLKEVVSGINTKLHEIEVAKDVYHLHLYSLGKKVSDSLNFIIFDS